MDSIKDTVQLSVKPRHLSGSAIAGKVRRAGLLPAVVYGGGVASQAVVLDPKPLKRGLQSAYGRNQLFSLAMADGAQWLAIARDVQVHPVTRALRHVDLVVVQPDTRIEVTLPVTTVGRSAGQKAGGRLEIIRREVQVSCTPATLPRLIEVDVTSMENGTSMMVDDLPMPVGVKPVYKKAFKVLEVLAAKIEAVAGAAAVEEKKPAAKK